MKLEQNLITGVKEIDEQHNELIKRINIITKAGKNGTSADELIPTLFFIRKYVSKHFSDEEQLHISSEYPKAAEHKAMHDSFSKKINVLFDKCNDSGVNLMTILETNKTLYDWLITHILKVDMEFAQYYKNK